MALTAGQGMGSAGGRSHGRSGEGGRRAALTGAGRLREPALWPLGRRLGQAELLAQHVAPGCRSRLLRTTAREIAVVLPLLARPSTPLALKRSLPLVRVVAEQDDLELGADGERFRVISCTEAPRARVRAPVLRQSSCPRKRRSWRVALTVASSTSSLAGNSRSTGWASAFIDRRTRSPALVALLHGEDPYRDRFALVHNVLDAFHATRRELGDVDETFDPAQVDHRAVLLGRVHHAFQVAAGGQGAAHLFQGLTALVPPAERGATARRNGRRRAPRAP